MRKRVFAALSILLAMAAAICARAASPAMFEYLVAPAGPGNQRNSEADMLLLKGGRLLLAWIDFYSDGRSDWSAARISAMISRDQGRTWGPKFTLQENIGGMNVMEPDMLRLKSGKVLFILPARTPRPTASRWCGFRPTTPRLSHRPSLCRSTRILPIRVSTTTAPSSSAPAAF